MTTTYHSPTPLSPRTPVITGLGTINPLGVDVASTWEALEAGTCAVRTLNDPRLEEFGVPVHIGAPLPVDIDQFLSPKERKRLDRATQCALIAAREAWAQAGLISSSRMDQADSAGSDDNAAAGSAESGSDAAAVVPSRRVAVSFSPGMGMVNTVVATANSLRERGARRVLPTAVPALMPNAAAATISIEIGAQAGAHAPASACASGAEAITHAADLIALGRADVVLAGGCDATLEPMPLAAFAAMRALSTRNDSPQTSSRPFATDRDGFVMGEGAGAVVVEAYEHAVARGAAILGVLAGYGMSSDAMDVARPDPSGESQEWALSQALEQAVSAGFLRDSSQVAHVNAHATSTPAGDAVEAAMLTRCLPNAVISATKSQTGHLLGGAGALEAVLTLCALQHSCTLPTLLPGDIDPVITKSGAVISEKMSPVPSNAAHASTSFGFGGHNVALIFTPAPQD
ncbi:beta-ketoacyl-[acyl-carrier-protein] synthase family protein [Actinomyces vulturis]|uniref:beta-ketoacyl-[acyl-carrier-protein] synthase family protein n=1 Tax=Actinomyces vulturis TaxID=1857645 RepID=UPI00082ED904|nr:beta-ketoacyl-[acyl-carrier-protein] synthase family protein [Actinomyces vulturis]